MIAGYMLHALVVAALCAGAAWLTERALAVAGGPRRFAWALGMALSILLPLSALVVGANAVGEAVTVTMQTSGTPPSADIPMYFTGALTMPAMAERPRLEMALAFGWGTLSLAFFAVYFMSSVRLFKRSQAWVNGSLANQTVLLAVDLGPAVFGFLRSRVVLPRWLLDAPPVTQRLALAHENQHVAARDPQLLAVGFALLALFPWNLALLWQLLRLRFALEVDCDARVLADGVDPVEYGEALLSVSQRKNAAPFGAIALIERPSQLERRINIMTASPSRLRAAIAASCLVLAATCVLAAAKLDTPLPQAGDVPLKPTPDGSGSVKLGKHFERVLATRYPGLLEQDRAGTALVVVLLNDDWSIANAAQVMSSEGIEDVRVTEEAFAVLGLTKDAVPYVGVMGMQSPANPAHRVLMVFTERTSAGKRFVSHVFPDTRAIDRAIFRRYFPDATKGGMSAGENLWVLLDRAGNVLRSGQEPLKPSSWNSTLEQRFPDIKTQAVTSTPITDDAGEPIKGADGKELQLFSIWLAPGSPPPT